ncbi:MAG: methyltransferase domain-containing protein [Bacteroidales bacterium]
MKRNKKLVTNNYRIENPNNKDVREYKSRTTDYIILQDTLHHLEPLKNSLELFYRILKPKGKIILVEENGNCLPQVFKLYLQRGNKRVIDYYDEVLGKSLQMGMKIYVHKRLGKNFLKNQALLLRMRIQNIYDYSLRSSTTLQTLPNLFKENPELPKATQC